MSASVTWLTPSCCTSSKAHADPCRPGQSTSMRIRRKSPDGGYRTGTKRAKGNYIRPPVKQADLTREGLLRAGPELSPAQGYRATTPSDIARHAGVAEGA